MNEPKRKTWRARLTGWLKGETTPGVDPDVVRDMAKLLEETGLSEIEVERGGVRVRVAKNGSHGMAAPVPAQAQPLMQAMPMAIPVPALQPAAPPQAAAPRAEEPKAEPKPKRGVAATSPMVGTVYLSPQPGSPSYVQEGATVREGDTLCVIEAMKTMNPVTAPVSGKILEISVKNSEPVEFGQQLMLIE